MKFTVYNLKVQRLGQVATFPWFRTKKKEKLEQTKRFPGSVNLVSTCLKSSQEVSDDFLNGVRKVSLLPLPVLFMLIRIELVPFWFSSASCFFQFSFPFSLSLGLLILS
jgi:hypothetical protein